MKGFLVLEIIIILALVCMAVGVQFRVSFLLVVAQQSVCYLRDGQQRTSVRFDDGFTATAGVITEWLGTICCAA